MYLARAFPETMHELKKEISLFDGKIVDEFGEWLIYTDMKRRPVWAQCVGRDPQVKKIDSIGDAAKILLNIKKRWCSESIVEHRRAELIQDKVFRYKIPELDFLQPFQKHDWGFWTLRDKNSLLFCESLDVPLPLGMVRFKPSEEPPSRAYLKLWEAMTCHGVAPKQGESVVDLGACPGGWTWVLAEMGCNVKSVDKAPLDEKILRYKNVEYLKKDAFRVGVEDLGNPQWIFSDVICYPQDLYQLVLKWMELGVKNFVCTLKFKGETDWKTIKDFESIDGGHLVHLCANKHELTFIKINSEK